MTRTSLASLLVVAAGCGGTSARSSVSNTNAPDGARCPSGDRVRIAVFTDGPPHDAEQSAPEKWRMPLVIKTLDQNAESAGPTPTTMDALRAAGAPEIPARVSMYWAGARGNEPCAATVGPAYRAVGGYGFLYEELGVELTGCAAPTDARVAWISLDEAPGCTFAAARQDGLHRWEGDRWEGKTSGSPALPAPLAPFVPAAPTGATPQGFTWETTAARVGDHVLAWRLYTAHVTSPVGTEACEVEAEESMQQLVVVGTKVSPVVERGNPATWNDLAGVFAVGTDPRVIVLYTVEEFTTIDIARDGTPGPPRSTTFYVAHEEDNHLDSALMPYCGP